MKMNRLRRSLAIFFGLGFVLACQTNLWAGGGCLEIRKGYFWDPLSGDYFIPRGIAYQTWNPPVGADQSFDQLEYDLIEIKKLHANSVRCEMVWNQLEPDEGKFDFRKPDFLVSKAEQLGLKLFVLIGFQYAPAWFTNHGGWQATNSHGEISVVLNYEDPGVRSTYSNYISQVTHRYRNSTAIGAWILGNEYAYWDLWNTNRLYLGFDPITEASYRTYISNYYGGNLTALNTNYNTSYSSFEEVQMPLLYPPSRFGPAYTDLTKWREYSIGEYVAVGAAAAKSADPNHLRTYSMIGGLFIGHDAFYTCENGKTIVERCKAAGAPLDFWSINNYAWASFSKELRGGDFGISKHRAESGLPVLVSETGFTSTDVDFPDAIPRQADAVPTGMWEALMSGAMGTHIFTWNDRELFGGEYFIRERGFGIVTQARLLKPAFPQVGEMFRRMEELKVERLFGGSIDPAADTQFLWSDAAKMGWPRANQENAFLWGTLKRLGYEPGILGDEQFERGDYTNGSALVLSRCYQMKPEHLDEVLTNVVPRGVHVYANADLPGQFDNYHRTNSKWASAMNTLFGLDVSRAYPGLDAAVDAIAINPLNLTGVQSLGALTNGYRHTVKTWQIWHGLTNRSGSTIATHTGNQGTQRPLPALQIKDSGTARAAVNTFAVGDLEVQKDLPPSHAWDDWDFRYDWLRAIYRDWFGMVPQIDLSGPGSHYVIPDYRYCPNGTILISLLNAKTNTAQVTLTAPALLNGRVVENLTAGGILDDHSEGSVSLPMRGDEFVLLYAYTRSSGVDNSLVNSNANKIWFHSAPEAVWPNRAGYEVSIGYDTSVPLDLAVRFETMVPTRKIYAVAPVRSISGKGTNTVTIQIPEADLGDVYYISSADVSTSFPECGEYLFRARLQQGNRALAEVTLPVRLLWGVRPQWLPTPVVPGTRYDIPLAWQELPAYKESEAGLPLSRASRWQQIEAENQYYEAVLELRDGQDRVVASGHLFTNQGSGTNTVSLTVPANAVAPFKWLAYLRPSPGVSHAFFDSFEERTPGSAKDEWKRYPDSPSTIWPWESYNYPNPGGTQLWLDEGAGTNASLGSLGAFLIVTNPPPPLGYSGFGIHYTYPEPWSLSNDFREWTNYTFSCDYLDTLSNACILELQVKDDLGGGIHFMKDYSRGSNGWDTISAPLSRFAVMTNPPASGYFNQARVHELVVNVQMQDSDALYAANFDQIRLTVPENTAPATTSNDVFDSFEDRPQGDQPQALQPWNPYSYQEPGAQDQVQILASGVQPTSSDGFRSAFVVVQNPRKPGGYSGFGMYREFTNAWALSSNQNQWTNYVFSFDFREANGYPCTLELQVKSSSNQWVSVFKKYTGSNQWDTIKATLADFIVPNGSAGFDPNHVQTLVLNVSMDQKNVIYLASFDNVRFDGPDTPLPPELRYGTFSSSGDFPRDSDGDGILDPYETGTGIFRSPTDTGTDRNNPDTDGDGLTDGQELIAGTDPNKASDMFRLVSIERGPAGEVHLVFPAHVNRLYSVYAADSLLPDGGGFFPVPELMNLSTAVDGMVEVEDWSADASTERYYRISVESKLP